MADFAALAYGAAIHSQVALREHLAGGEYARHELSLVKGGGQPTHRELAHSSSLLSSHGRDLWLFSDREMGLRKSGQPWAFKVLDVVTFRWLTGRPVVEYELGKEGDERLLAFWFIHIFLPLYLTLEENYDFLHAGAVEVDGRVVMFVAPSTGGKSTLTEYFVRQGHALLADDKVATYVEGARFMAVPSHANYRPYRRAEDLGFRAEDFRDTPQAIHAIYALQRVAAEEDVRFREIKGFRKFDRLMPNYIFGFTHLRRKRLEYLAGLVNRVPLYEVDIPHDITRLGEVYGAICQHQSQSGGVGKSREPVA